MYGYSLTVYIPVSVFWVIQVSWLQWFLALGGAGLSAAVLVTSIWPAVSQIEARRFLVLGIVLTLHVILAAGFMLYFFHASPSEGVQRMEVVPVSQAQISNATSAHV